MKVLVKEKLSEHKYKTPEGYLICVDAVLARTGKQTYKRCEIFADAADDESEVEVDRTYDEVFSPQTLASFENKPLTVEHPSEDVNSGNFKEYAVGFVRDVHQGVVDGQDVILGTLVIQDEQTIEEIENGEHTDLSCGYDCDIVDEANPQQRNIRGNHVALCECGRAGNARIVDSVKDKKGEKFFRFKYFDKNNMMHFYSSDSSDFEEAKKELDNFAKSRGEFPYRIDSYKIEIDDSIRDVKFTHNNLNEFSKITYKGKKAKIARIDWPFKINEEPSILIRDPETGKLIWADIKEIELRDSTDDSVKDSDYRVGDFVIYKGKTARIISKTPDKITIKGYPNPKGFVVWFYTNEFEEAIKNKSIIIDSIKDNDKIYTYIMFGTTGEKRVDNLTLAEAEHLLKNNRLLGYDGKIVKTTEIKDKLIESSSEEALQKNIKTEIKSGKDPKQAAAIAYSVQRENDSETPYEEVTKHLEEKIDDANEVLKGIIFKTDVGIPTSKFTDFIGDYIVKLSGNVYMFYWNNGTPHQEMELKLKNFNPYDVEYFATSLLPNGKIDEYDFNRLSKYSGFKRELITKAMKHFRVNDSSNPADFSKLVDIYKIVKRFK